MKTGQEILINNSFVISFQSTLDNLQQINYKMISTDSMLLRL